MLNQSYHKNHIVYPIRSFIPFLLNQLASSFAGILNLFSMIIILRIKETIQLFKYILVISSISFFYSILWIISDLIELFSPDTYSKFIFLIIVEEYLVSCLAMFIIFIDVYLALQRLFLLMNTTWLDKVSFNKSIIFFSALMLLYYLPVLAEFKISPVGNTTFTLERSEYARSRFGISIRLILTIFRVLCLILILPVINICTFLILRKHLRKKLKIQSKSSRVLKSKSKEDIQEVDLLIFEVIFL